MGVIAQFIDSDEKTYLVGLSLSCFNTHVNPSI